MITSIDKLVSQVATVIPAEQPEMEVAPVPQSGQQAIQGRQELEFVGPTMAPPTELEYANKLAAKLPPVMCVGKQWFAYSNGTWREQSRDLFRPISLEVLPPPIRKERLSAILLDHLEARFQVSRETFGSFHRFDGADVLINARNCVVRVTPSGTITTEPHSEVHGFTGQLAANYDPTAQAPTFERVQTEALPDVEDRKLLQALCGNFLLPSSKHEVCGVFLGEGGCGKSTIADPVAAVFGSELVTSIGMAEICNTRSYSLHRLQYAALNLGTELDSIEMSDSANFKAVVTGERMEARPIYGSPFTMTPRAKLLFLANSMPRFKNGSEAEYRRLRFLCFRNKPAVKDVGLKAKLLTELDGVLQFMLEGLVGVMNLQGEFPFGGEESRKIRERFKVSNDGLRDFVETRCTLGTNLTADKDVIKAAYRDYCEGQDLRPMPDNTFCGRLKERFGLSDIQVTKDGRRGRHLVGIAMKPTLPD